MGPPAAESGLPQPDQAARRRTPPYPSDRHLMKRSTATSLTPALDPPPKGELAGSASPEAGSASSEGGSTKSASPEARSKTPPPEAPHPASPPLLGLKRCAAAAARVGEELCRQQVRSPRVPPPPVGVALRATARGRGRPEWRGRGSGRPEWRGGGRPEWGGRRSVSEREPLGHAGPTPWEREAVRGEE
jgi:hypothetical protein